MNKIINLILLSFLLALNVHGQGNFFGSHRGISTPTCPNVTWYSGSMNPGTYNSILVGVNASANSILFFHVVMLANETCSSSSGWTLLSSSTGTNLSQSIYYKKYATATVEDATFTFSGTGSKVYKTFEVSGGSTVTQSGSYITTTARYTSHTTSMYISVEPCETLIFSIIGEGNQTITNNYGGGWLGYLPTKTASGGGWCASLQYNNFTSSGYSPTTIFSWPSPAYYGVAGISVK